MQAIVVEQTGGPEVLRVQERATPDPGPGEVCVDVAACGVNFIDIYQRSGVYAMNLPFIAGSEGAGVVRSVGEGVTEVAVGDHVAWAGVAGGGYVSQALVPEQAAVPVPEGLDDEAAAALMLQGMTAHYLCESTYPVQKGDDVLLYAGAGGVGLLLTQMVARKGARVIATTSTEDKAALAREAGAAEVIDYTKDDVAEEVRRLTDGVGAAVVYDGIGKATFESSLDSLRRRGMLVLFGGASGPVPPVDPQVLNSKGSLFLTRPKLADHTADRTELLWRASDVLGAAARGELSVRVGGRYPLSEAGRAHEDLAGRRTTGKLLLLPQ
ncbi:MAG TPA: quinone oxidoreductase [Nocardioidaceae bacterium]|nr:quinone oxidoreductase [Nocardioidaceae bacterium]